MGFVSIKGQTVMFQINYMLVGIWGLSTFFAVLPLLGINGYISEVSFKLDPLINCSKIYVFTISCLTIGCSTLIAQQLIAQQTNVFQLIVKQTNVFQLIVKQGKHINNLVSTISN